MLLAKARELLENPAQGLLGLDVEPTLPVARLVTQPAEPALFKIGEAPAAEVGRDGPGRVVDTDCRLLFEALAAVYADLGFDVLGDEVFRDLVIARVVEPTSLLDMGRVLTELGRSPASYSTMRRTLVRAEEREYRDRVATACFAHAASTGDVSLILYDDRRAVHPQRRSGLGDGDLLPDQLQPDLVLLRRGQHPLPRAPPRAPRRVLLGHDQILLPVLKDPPDAA